VACAVATAPGTMPADPAKLKLATRQSWHEGMLPGHHTTHIVRSVGKMASPARTSHINSFRADNSPPAGPFGTEFMSDNVPLCAIPLLHCHADC